MLNNPLTMETLFTFSETTSIFIIQDIPNLILISFSFKSTLQIFWTHANQICYDQDHGNMLNNRLAMFTFSETPLQFIIQDIFSS